MTKPIERQKIPFLIPPQEADFERILGDEPFVYIRGQLLFKTPKGQLFITHIDEEYAGYTIKEYQTLPENAPFQLIQGKLVYMPSPFFEHQRISMSLSYKFYSHIVENQLDQLIAAPMDVIFDEKNVLQPDLLFISNDRKDIIQQHIKGAPDLVIEILFKRTQEKDEKDKKEVYGKHNVLEYWIINPDEHTIQIFNNKNGKMRLTQKIHKKGRIPSKVLPTLNLDLSEIL